MAEVSCLREDGTRRSSCIMWERTCDNQSEHIPCRPRLRPRRGHCRKRGAPQQASRNETLSRRQARSATCCKATVDCKTVLRVLGRRHQHEAGLLPERGAFAFSNTWWLMGCCFFDAWAHTGPWAERSGASGRYVELWATGAATPATESLSVSVHACASKRASWQVPVYQAHANAGGPETQERIAWLAGRLAGSPRREQQGGCDSPRGSGYASAGAR